MMRTGGDRLATGEGSRARVEARRLLELAALTGLALVQPMLDVLGRSPETFVFRRVDGADLVAFAFVVALGPALVLWLIGLVSGLFGPRVRRLVHLGELAVLLGIAVLVGLKSADALFGRAALLAAMATAGLGVVAYLRFRGVRLFLSYLSILPLLALGAFLFASPAAGLVRGPEYDIVADPGTTTPLVMLVVDEFPTGVLLDRDGSVDARRFPSFARLSEDGRWYRNYSTVNNFTIHAVPALLSAEAPEADAVPLLDDHPRNLFTLLGGTYEFNVSEAITRLCPTELCPTEESAADAAGLGGIAEDARDVLGELVSLDAYPGPESDFFVEPVTTYDSSDDIFRQGRDAEVQPTRFRDFLDALEPSAGPSLHYLHLVLPHEPWRFFPDGTEYRSPGRDPRGDPAGIWLDEWPARLGRLRFELQARYTDRLVGQFLDRLQETPLWDEAVIVVVADHGAAFTPGEGRRVLTEENAHEIMWSNLFIRAPGLASGTTDVAMQSFDVLPTVADLLGTEVPWPIEGASVLAMDDGSMASTEGDRAYYRFPNRHFYEPEAVLSIEGPANLEALLTQEPAGLSARDPVGSLYGSTPLGDLYDRRVEDLDVGPPLDAVAEVEDLDDILRGDLTVLTAYIGGGLESAAVDDGAWVVAAVDGVVSGVSPLFAEERHPRGFHLLLDADRVGPQGTDLELYVVEEPGGPLRPIGARTE